MLDVRGSREIQAALLTLRGAERGIRTGINKRARSQIAPLWKSNVADRAHTPLQRRIIARNTGAAASDRGVTFRAATSTRPLRGGLVPAYQWQAAELGANPKRITVEQRSRKGRAYTRPLWVNTQWQMRGSFGEVAFDAASKTGTKLVALWVETVVDELRQIDAATVTPQTK